MTPLRRYGPRKMRRAEPDALYAALCRLRIEF